MESIVLRLQEWLAFYGLKVVAAVVILVLGRIAAGIIRRLLWKAMEKGRGEATLISALVIVSAIEEESGPLRPIAPQGTP